MRVHLLGLPHTETTRRYEWCAYTAKLRKLATMLTSVGHEVVLYAGADNEAEVAEHVPIVDQAWQRQHFGQYDWAHDVFGDFDASKPFWREFNSRAATAIRRRAEPGDVLGITMGLTHKPVADALADLRLLPVEVGIGYSGTWAPYRVYESYAWMHHLAGKYGSTDDFRPMDTVIPNFFEPASFPLGTRDDANPYYLFIGRFIRRKGVEYAVEATRQLGARLVMAGQGCRQDGQRFTGIDVTVEGDHLEHVGVVGPKRRAELMGAAQAVFVPTTYLEPFGGVAVEAMMCGTPVLATDYGAFTETVVPGVTGFRGRSVAQFVMAAGRLGELDRSAIREHAVGRYSTDVLRHRYDQYLRRVSELC